MKNLVPHLKFKHNMRGNEYKEKYGKELKLIIVKLTEETKQKIRDKYKDPEFKKWFKTKVITNRKPQYWLKKGYSEKEATNMVSLTQKQNSNWCIEYWLKKGYSEKEANKQIEIIQKEKSILSILHWLKKGYSEKEAKNIICELQSKNSKKSSKFLNHNHSDISKLKISSTLSKTILDIGATKWAKHFIVSRSKGEAELYNYICENFNIKAKANVDIKIYKERAYSVDILYKNKIIEFFGDFWHCNPKYFLNGEEKHKMTKQKIKDIWEHDKKRIKKLENNNYKIMIVWEDDWYNNKSEIIKKIKKFLK